jgi:hypothetical protein
MEYQVLLGEKGKAESDFFRNWKKPFKELEGGRVGLFMHRLLARLRKPLCLLVG